MPRDRQGSFDPQLIAKYQPRFASFDDKIVSMYARGMSTWEITGLLTICTGIDVSPDLISTVTDAALDGPWGTRYPTIGQSWRRAWSEMISFFALPDEVRRIVYSTNAIEALHSKLRRAVRARGHFRSDEAATKLLYLIPVIFPWFDGHQ